MQGSASRVLVTGSQGFVGRALRSALGDRGCAVIGVDVAGSGAEIVGDLSEPDFDPEALAQQIGAVGGIIHLAARITRGSSVDVDARRNVRAVAEAPVRLAEAWRAAHGPTHVVFCSSIKVYGPSTQVIDPLTTALHPEPWSYGSAKALAERLLAVSARRAGFTCAFVRPSFVYGPGQRAATAIPIFLRACWRGESPVLFGAGRELRDDVLVSDVATCLAEACLRRAEGPFNAAGECSRTLAEVAQLCCQAVEDVGGPKDLHPKLDGVRAPKPWLDQTFDWTRTRELLGYQPTPLLEGLRRQAASIRDEAP